MKISKGKVKNINKKLIASLLTFTVISTSFIIATKEMHKEVANINYVTDIVPKPKTKRLYKKGK